MLYENVLFALWVELVILYNLQYEMLTTEKKKKNTNVRYVFPMQTDNGLCPTGQDMQAKTLRQGKAA